MKIYNSLTRTKEELKPLKPNEVGMYTCGPTVYNFAHIGNFRAYSFEDILRRTLEFEGNTVTQVMNLTDVDDKTIRGSRTAHIALRDFTAPYIKAFFEDLSTLNIEKAAVYPAATDHIVEMQALIAKLFERGLAYKSEDGSVYFSVSKLQGYGKLAHLDRDNLRQGERVASDEYEKEGYGDFALWKAYEPEEDGDVVWDSPWGRGRPGWHLECSAMSMKYLGETFDLHTGGIDNLFPHHENEIAQAEGATGKPFVNYWMHCAHLRVNGEKMSKSLGNFFTLRDLIAKGWTGREIRYVLINGHYRAPLNFTFDALAAARTALTRVDGCVAALTEKAGQTGTMPSGSAAEHLAAFSAAVADDLNIPEALASLFNLVRETNAAMNTPAGISVEDAASALSAMHEMDRVLGVIFFGRSDAAEDAPAEIKAMADARIEARKNKNWAESDRLRDAIASAGWEVRDTKDGQKLRKH